MAIFQVEFTSDAAPTTVSVARRPKIALVGYAGTTDVTTFNANTIQHGTAASAFTAAAGTNSFAGSNSTLQKFIDALYQGNSAPELWVIRVLESYTRDQVNGQIAKLGDLGEFFDFVSCAGPYTGEAVSDNTTQLSAWSQGVGANTIAAALQSLATKVRGLAIVGTEQSTHALDGDWGTLNAKDRTLGVSNQVDGNNPAAYLLAAWSAQIRTVGRGQGLDGAVLQSGASLDYPVSSRSTQVATNDTKNVASIVSDRGVLRVAGGEFNLTSATADERSPDISLRKNYVQQQAEMYAEDNLRSKPYTAARVASDLTDFLQPLVEDPTNAITQITVSPEGDQGGKNRRMRISITLIAAIGLITLHTVIDTA